jgi:uncharacterized protein (TIGR03066 family)
MKLAKGFAVGAVLCLVAGVGRGDEKGDAAKLIVGKWEVTKADPGTAPPGGIIQFTKDGKMKLTAKKDDKEISVEGTYKVEGKKLSFAITVGGEKREKTITITKLTTKEMATKDDDGKTVELTRKK